MNRMYEFMLKLQDMFSPQLMKMANTYGKVIGGMERKKKAIGGVFHEAGQSVDTLRRKLLGLSGTPARVRVDTSEIDAATRKAGKLRDEFGRFKGGSGSGGGGSGGESGGMLGRMMRGGALGGMLLGGLGGYLGAQGLQMAGGATIAPAMAAERNQFSMGVMMHSPEQAQMLTDQLRKYAADNPLLGNAEVQSMGTQMVGLGYKMEQILPVMKSLGDVAAGSSNNLSDLVLVLGQVKMKGRLQAEELMQFAERRVNLVPYLAKVKGVNESQISQMVTDKKVSYQDVEKAFGMMSGKGGMFEDMSSRTANETSFGKYQQIMGDLENKGLSLGQSLLPYVNKFLGFVSKMLDNIGPLERGFGIFSEAVKGAFTFLNELVGISDPASQIMERLGLAFAFVGNVINIITGVLSAFINSPLAMLITGLMALPWIIGTVQAAWFALNAAFIATPIGFIIAAVVGLVAALMTAYEKVDWFREGLMVMWETAKTVFSNIGKFFKLIVSGDIAGALAVVGSTVQDAAHASFVSIQKDRQSRLGIDPVEDRRKRRRLGIDGIVGPDGLTPPGTTPPGKTPSGGISSTVGSSKSQNITISVGSLIAKSEINVMDFNGDISQLESKVIEALSRLINSANQIAVS